MYRPPFHRQVLPWIFVIVFFALAPAVVFYTAGYRYNAKKGVVERNGTIIVDSRPRGAFITLNGERQDEVSPVTIQHVAPGSYTIRLEREGYHVWEKVLEIRPELVTFVNLVELWRNAEPTLVERAPSGAISLSPNGRYLAYQTHEADERFIVFLDIPNQEMHRVAMSGENPEGRVLIRWNELSNAVFVQDERLATWVMRRTDENATGLLSGFYRWEGDTLVGIFEDGQVRYDTSNDAIQRLHLEQGIQDRTEEFSIQQSSGTGDLVLQDETRKDVVYELPMGDWSFQEMIDGIIPLVYDNQWLFFQPDREPVLNLALPSREQPELIDVDGETRFLSYDEGEIWMMRLGEQPELILRRSEPIQGALWHRRGNHIFYATNQDVFALELDQRDGREEIRLAHFDEVYGISMVRRALYISGRMGDTSGIWALEVE